MRTGVAPSMETVIRLLSLSTRNEGREFFGSPASAAKDVHFLPNQSLNRFCSGAFTKLQSYPSLLAVVTSKWILTSSISESSQFSRPIETLQISPSAFNVRVGSERKENPRSRNGGESRLSQVPLYNKAPILDARQTKRFGRRE